MAALVDTHAEYHPQWPRALFARVLALAGLFWLISSAFQSLATFVIGIMIAYIALPIVDWLDRFLPRGLAVLLVILGEIAVVGLFLALLIPAVVQEIQHFVQSLPKPDQVRIYFDQLDQQAHSWPEPVRVFLAGLVADDDGQIAKQLHSIHRELLVLRPEGSLSLLTAFSFLLGLLVIPTWIFAVLNDQRKGVQAINHILPEWLRPDFWAVAHILDRTFRVYFRELVVMAVAVGFVTYGGLVLLERLGVQGIPFRYCWRCWQAYRLHPHDRVSSGHDSSGNLRSAQRILADRR